MRIVIFCLDNATGIIRTEKTTPERRGFNDPDDDQESTSVRSLFFLR